MLRTLLFSARHATRALARSPLFTAAGIGVVGLGLGLSLLLFSTVQALFWRPLPFPGSGELQTVVEPDHGIAVLSRLQAEALSREAQVGLRRGTGDLSLRMEGRTRRVATSTVNADYFRLLGLRPLAGRFFDESDDRGEAFPRSVVLTERTWRALFGADPGVVGRRLESREGTFRVVGVVPGDRTLPFLKDQGMLLPLAWRKGDPASDRWGMHRAFFRPHRPGEEGRAVTAGILAALEGRGASYRVLPLREALAPTQPGAFLLLLGAAALLLLLATANVAGLFLARALARAREEAVRAALGGGLGEALRRHLLEALLVSAGGLLGALALVRLGRPWMLELVPELRQVGPELLGLNLPLLLVGALLAVGVALSLAALPALQAGRLDLARSMAEGSSATSRQSRWPALLLGAQTALVLALLVGSGLLARSLGKALTVDPGFPTRELLSCAVEPPEGLKNSDWTGQVRRVAEVLPGVRGAALSGLPPFSAGLEMVQPGPRGDVTFQFQPLGPGALEVLGLPLLEGRTLEAGDEAAGGVVLNQQAARAFFGAEPAVGRSLEGRERPSTVVGVVADSRLSGLDQPPPPILYRLERGPSRVAHVLVRTAHSPKAFEGLLSERLQAAGLTEEPVQVSAAEALAAETVQSRVRLPLVAGAFSLVGLSLAASGLAASLGALLALQRRELALRMALGSTPARLLGGLLWATLRPMVLGILAGLILSLGLARLVGSLLYGITANDPLSYLLSAGLLVLVAFATVLPRAFRASRIAPAQALRTE